MKTNADIEAYLVQANVPFERAGDGTWFVRVEPSDFLMVLRHEPPILEFRVNVGPVPEKNREEFFRQLLEWNATDVIHGAYGIIDDKVVVTCALQSENLDFNELEAAIDSIALQLQQHFPKMKEFYNKGGEE